MATITARNVRWRGKRLDDLSREEMMEALTAALNRVAELDGTAAQLSPGNAQIARERIGSQIFADPRK